jgi:hydroxypyruvate reductase/glycerate 2-kinase
LLPAPVDGVSLEDKQAMTRFLHRSGATIAELNCVRKHLSRIKGGGLAAATRCSLVALIISDVVGDPLNVIASGPTAPDPTTFADALDVLRKFDLVESVPAATRYLKAGARGERPETSKTLPQSVTNVILANNRRALSAAAKAADIRGYNLVDLGSFVEGETRDVARVAAAIVRSTASDGIPTPPPACILIGGETTVTLPPAHGRGGRNTEFVLAGLLALESAGLNGYVVLSGGTDGEDGPTDAAGAIGDHATLATARRLGLDPADSLRRHDSYTFFDATGDLFRTGLTQTNVMDVRVLLIDRP